MGLDYKDAGVDVEAGYKSVKLMREGKEKRICPILSRSILGTMWR